MNGIKLWITQAAWFLGEKQVIHVTNAGMTFNG